MEEWALVLGVSGVAGSSIARAVARDPGLNVVGIHRGHHPEAARVVAADFVDIGKQIVLLEAEAGTAEAAEHGVARVLDRLGPRKIKLFVHAIANASLGTLTGEGALVPRQIEKTFASMAHSFVYWTRALVERDMLAPSARILGLTNPMPESLMRNAPLIAATKAALQVYAKHLAWELGPKGHRVNLLKYGCVITPAVRKTFGDEIEHLEKVIRRITPAGRMVAIEDVAKFVCVLCSDRAEWFNGAVIDFSGGEFQALYDALIHPER